MFSQVSSDPAKRLRSIILHTFLGVSLSACLAPADEHNGNNDRQDQLGAHDPNVEIRYTHSATYGTYQSHQSLSLDSQDQINIVTDQYLYTAQHWNPVSIKIGQILSSRGSFFIEYRDTGSQEWKKFSVAHANLEEGAAARTRFTYLHVAYNSLRENSFTLTALSENYGENQSGQFIPNQDSQVNELEVYVDNNNGIPALEFRIIPIPVWNYGDWEPEYSFDLSFKGDWLSTY